MNAQLTKSIIKFKKTIKNNAPVILTVAGITSGILACVDIFKSAPATKEALDDLHEYQKNNDIQLTKPQALWEDVKVAAPIIGPGIAKEAISIIFIASAYKSGSKQTLAALSTAEFSRATLDEYRRKMVEKLGPEKEKEVRDEIAKDHCNNYICDVDCRVNPGEYPCYDTFTRSWFSTTEQKIYKAANTINARLRKEHWVDINEFYYELGRESTGYGGMMGWHIDKIPDDGFSCKVSGYKNDYGVPCLMLDYEDDIIADQEAFYY